MKIHTVELEIPDELADKAISVRALRNTNEGRELLIKLGFKTEAEAKQIAKQQHRRGAKSRSGPFLGWDGEGVTGSDGRHRYTLLNCSNLCHIANPNGIPTEEALDFLCAVANEHPKANHVMFGGSYDANMILTDLGYYQAKRLAERGVLHWKDYRIEYMPKKFFRVSRYLPGDRHNKQTRIATITIWDVIGFFQCSFVKALEQWLSHDATFADLAFIKGMKAKRSQFTAEDASQVLQYCVRECELLETLMSKLRNQMRLVDLVPSRWDGAGALAATMLSRNKVKQYYPETIPDDVQEASQYAYFGGRIEMARFGNYEQTVYAHDIVSAYPSVMPELPCLAHGSWYRGYHPNGYEKFTLVRVEFRGANRDMRPMLYPLPLRNSIGNVYFPPSVNGWYWEPEIENLRTYWHDDYIVLDRWTWIQECDHRPFAFVPDIFERRQELKSRGHHANIVLKLGLNSIYGKLAQQVGWKEDNSPTYHNLLWAGYITSATRAKTYQLAMRDPASVIAFETDGVYATEKLYPDPTTILQRDYQTIPARLGEWEVTEYDGIIYVQSGLYWVNKKVLDDPGVWYDDWKPKYRGFDPDTIDRELVINAWEHGYQEIQVQSKPRFRGMRTSTVSPERFVEWKQWITDPRTVALYPGPGSKRIHFPTPKCYHPECYSVDWSEGMPQEPLHMTYPIPYPTIDSCKHKLAWLDDPERCTMDNVHSLRQAGLDEDDERYDE